MNKQQQIEKLLNKPFEVGDSVYVRGLGSQDKNSFFRISEIEHHDNGKFKIKNNNDVYSSVDFKHYLGDIGANPFPKNKDRISSVAFSLESVLFSLGLIESHDKSIYKTKLGHTISDCNWNPFVINKNGEKEYYQRGFVWSEDDNRNLIESIYQNVDCGKILVRLRSWSEAELMGEEASFRDIVDGKQRLNAMRLFVNDKFADNYGNYFSELSDQAQRKLLEHQLFSYSEMSENTKDEDVIRQFLKLNFCGVPQSKEHIEFVKSISKNF